MPLLETGNFVDRPTAIATTSQRQSAEIARRVAVDQLLVLRPLEHNSNGLDAMARGSWKIGFAVSEHS